MHASDQLGERHLYRFDKHNRDLLVRFLQHKIAQGVSEERANRIAVSWKKLQPHVDFRLDEADRGDVERLVGVINQNRINDRDYKPWTKKEFRGAVRMFYVWHTGRSDPDIVDWMTVHPPEKDKPKADPRTLPQEEHVHSLRTGSTNVRDEAFIMLLWESGARISEMLDICWGDLDDAGDVLWLRVDGKTGERKIPLCECRGVLEKWREKHPEPVHDQFVWCRMYDDEKIGYKSARKIIDRAARNCDIPDRIALNPHAFRKGRATYLANNGFNVFELCEMFGWEQLETAKIYVRLASSNLEDALARLHGKNVRPGQARLGHFSR